MPSILNQNEEKKKEMLDFADKHGFSANETIRCSQDLDKLLNKYNESKLRSLKNTFLF